jgi:hypothetical protein
MAMQMGAYCKAYPIDRFRAYRQWTEQAQNARTETQVVDGKEVTVTRTLGEDAFLYLQENYCVTDGIFIDENIIFADVSEAWLEYCKTVLAFDPEGRDVTGSESEAAADVLAAPATP